MYIVYQGSCEVFVTDDLLQDSEKEKVLAVIHQRMVVGEQAIT